jgi:hypothetical protein
VRADIQIDIPRNVWLQGPSTAIELSGNMRVTKDLYAPFSRTLKVRGGIMSQANSSLGGLCSSQRIFPPQIIQVLLSHNHHLIM